MRWKVFNVTGGQSPKTEQPCSPHSLSANLCSIPLRSRSTFSVGQDATRLSSEALQIIRLVSRGIRVGNPYLWQSALNSILNLNQGTNLGEVARTLKVKHAIERTSLARSSVWPTCDSRQTRASSNAMHRSPRQGDLLEHEVIRIGACDTLDTQ